ncbi:MAG: phage tail family protein [Kiritimatiellae bacterium]|nr:phage tail family protein [Kiritimatiellia bacterium]
MITKTWTVNGETFTFGMPFNLEYIEGMGGAPAEIKTQRAPYQNGVTVREKNQKERPLTLYVEVFADSEEQLLERRAYMTRLFNALNEPGIFTYGDRAIAAEVDGGPRFTRARGHSTPMIIHLLAPDPNFYDPVEEVINLVGFRGGWSFPWKFPRTFGVVGASATATNRGNVSTPVIITVTGYTRYPMIENETTGERIIVDIEIPEGRILEITTQFNNKRVEIVDLDGNNRESVFYNVVRDEKYSLWEMVPGDNNIRYTAAEESGDAGASIRYFHRYSGV